MSHPANTAAEKPQQAAELPPHHELQAWLAQVVGYKVGSPVSSQSLNVDWLATPLGAMIAVADQHALQLLEFVDREALPRELQRLQAGKGTIGIGRFAATDQIEAELGLYFAGTLKDFQTPLAQSGSDFTRAVWAVLQDIPPGKTRSYGQVAKILGRPTASRAVARANGANQIAIAVPCHRVIGADNSLTGYGGGIWRKQWLLDHERRCYCDPAVEQAASFN